MSVDQRRNTTQEHLLLRIGLHIYFQVMYLFLLVIDYKTDEIDYNFRRDCTSISNQGLMFKDYNFRKYN